MFRLLLTISFFHLIKLVSASDFVGRIQDSYDNEVLAGAIVQNIETGEFTVSDPNGKFIISSVQDSSLMVQISLLGYSSVYFKLLNHPLNGINEIKMKPVVKDMETVVVTGTRSDKLISESPVLTQVIYPVVLAKKGVVNLTEALEKEVPGLNFSSFNTQRRVSFQGMSSRYILFLVDGERIAGEMNGDIDYSRLNLANIDRIEVIRGPSSAIYGSNGIGGVVNIITKPPTNRLEYTTFGRYSDYNETNFSNAFGFKKSKISGRTVLSLNQHNGYDLTPTTKGSWTQEKFKNGTINQQLYYQINKKLNVQANAQGFYKRIYDSHIRTSDHGYAGVHAGGKSVYKFNQQSKIEAAYMFDRYQNYNIRTLLDDRHDQSADHELHNIRLLGFHDLGKFELTGGVESLNERIMTDKILGNTKNSNELTGWAQAEYQYSNSLRLTGGVRYTNHSIFGQNIVPKFTLMKTYPHYTFRFNYGMGFRSPTLKELYYDFDHLGQFRLIGSDRLVPEKSQSFNISNEFNYNQLNIAANLFYSRISEMIYNKTLSADSIQYQNIASAEVYGIDLMVRLLTINGFNLSSGLSISDSYNFTTRRELYDSSPLSGNLVFSYTKRFKGIRYTGEIYGKYTGQREYEPIGPEEFIDDPFQMWKFSLSALYKSRCTITVGVENLFNTVDPESFGNLSSGRTAFIAFHYKFTRN